jgi:hypothetical protein
MVPRKYAVSGITFGAYSLSKWQIVKIAWSELATFLERIVVRVVTIYVAQMIGSVAFCG